MAPEASAAVEVLQEFVNTREVETGGEVLENPSALREWLAGHGLLDPSAPVTPADLRLALELRETLRALAAANNEGGSDPEAVGALNRIADGLPLALRLDPAGGARLEPLSPGAPGAIARLLGIVFRAAVDGSWTRFKACHNDACRWAFHDVSKNRSRRWCASESCGNVMNARAYRSRRRQDPPSDPD